MLKTEKADALHRTPKAIVETVQWRPIGGTRFRIDVEVFAPEAREVLRLVCNYTNGDIYSFCLLYQNHPVRMFTKHRRHKSKSAGQKIYAPHKHKWDEVCETDNVYIPNDIDPDSDLNEQLLSFLREENIDLKAEYQRLLCL